MVLLLQDVGSTSRIMSQDLTQEWHQGWQARYLAAIEIDPQHHHFPGQLSPQGKA